MQEHPTPLDEVRNPKQSKEECVDHGEKPWKSILKQSLIDGINKSQGDLI